jgi:hypothetical protein
MNWRKLGTQPNTIDTRVSVSLFDNQFLKIVYRFLANCPEISWVHQCEIVSAGYFQLWLAVYFPHSKRKGRLTYPCALVVKGKSKAIPVTGL